MLGVLNMSCTVFAFLLCSAERSETLHIFTGAFANPQDKLAHVDTYERIIPRKLPTTLGKRDLSAQLVSISVSNSANSKPRFRRQSSWSLVPDPRLALTNHELSQTCRVASN